MSRSTRAELPLLAGEPALGAVEELLDVPVPAADASERDPRTLPELVVVDLGDGGAEAILQLRLRGADEMPLALQRPRLGEVQLGAEDADVA